MAREHAQIKLALWDDDDFLDLTPAEQHLYKVLLTSRSLSYCGVADWRPNRIAGKARTWTAEAVRAAADGLVANLFILVDEGTEEVLIRSWIRHDGLMKQPQLATAMATAYSKVSSRALRGVIVHELRRLRADEPELRGWGSEKALEVLTKASIDPATYPLGQGAVHPSGHPAVQGDVHPSIQGDPHPSVQGPVQDPSTPFSFLLPPLSSLQAPDEGLRPSVPDSAVTAQTVVGSWVDAVKAATGASPSRGQIGQVGKLAKELLEKNDPQRVVAAAEAAGRKGFATIDRELTSMLGIGRANGQRPVLRDPNSGIFVER